jgi:DNA primase large subunit
MMLDLNQISRYPFLEESRESVRKMNLTLTEMLSDENSAVLDKAMSRIEGAVDGKKIELTRRRMVGEVETDLLSYPVARFLVAAVGDRHLIKWFSHHEGERAHSFLQEEDAATIEAIGEELDLPEREGPPPEEDERKRSSFDVRKVGFQRRERTGGGTVWLSFVDFLSSKRNISGSNWDLVNQRMRDGLVGIDRESYIRLLQEKIKERVEEGLEETPPVPDIPRIKEMVNALKTKVESRRRKYSPTELGRMTITRLPPCMRQILGMSQAGENLPHHARFALVAFLNALGMGPEEIFKVFTTAPDFKEDIVRYQVEHITGSSSATSYHSPNCDTMKSGGICFNPDGLCEKEWMNSPLYYYRIKGKKRKGATSRENAS